MRSFRHWSPHYLLDRTAYWLYQRKHPDVPWLTQSAVEILASWLRPSDVGFEWGAGRSTIWFAERLSHLTSVEHNERWVSSVEELLDVQRISNVTLLLRSIAGEEESDYVRAIDAMPQNGYDFVLIDGRLRHHCTSAAIDKVKPGGLLVIDNVNWYLPSNSRSPASVRTLPAEWQSVANRLVRWRTIWTSNGVTDTALFSKPLS
jgi:predicted O-methyltransferase YrrM